VRKISTADFIAKAHLVHGDRYNYSPTVYQGNKVKVEIVCPEHGVFTQTPANHNSGFGCINCGFKNAGQYHKKDTRQFIQEAQAIHGERYDYSSTQYRGAREKLTIVCLKHGPFLQTAGVHLRGDSGSGCELCSYELRGDNARLKFEEFTRRAVEIHDDAFDYSESKSSFIDAATNVTIGCLLHGPFQQTPTNHLKGQGCPRCSRTRMANELRKTNEGFVRDAKTVHGEKYDYSQCAYAGAFEAVTVICPIDGAFTQSPTSHLAGIGCPRCSRRAQGAPRNLTRALRGEFDEAKASFVYVVRFRLPFSDKQIYKIGSGTGTRLKTVSGDIRRIGGLDIEVRHHAFSSPGEAIVFEHLAHAQVMANQFVVPPEYKFHGHTEVFAKEPDLGTIESHLVMLRFRAGARWDPRKEPICDF
jgi:thymidylate kinase